MTSPYGNCDYDLCEDSITRYNIASYCVLGLTFVLIIFRVMVNQKIRARDGPGVTGLGRIHLLFGVAKIVGAILLLTVFAPDCSSCDITFIIFYPYIVFFLGLVWVGRGFQLIRLGQALQARPATLIIRTTAAPAAGQYVPPQQAPVVAAQPMPVAQPIAANAYQAIPTAQTVGGGGDKMAPDNV